MRSIERTLAASMFAVLAALSGCGPQSATPLVPPIPQPPAAHMLTGSLAAGSVASQTSTGNIAFALFTSSGVSYAVEVPAASATMTAIDVNGDATPLDATTAIGWLNSGMPLDIDVEGSSAPAGTSFTADLSLTLTDQPGGGFTFGLTGTAIAGSVRVQKGAGDITFDLDYPGTGTFDVRVDVSSAQLGFTDVFGNTRAIDTGEAVTMLNATPSFTVDVRGTESATATGFVADLALGIVDEPDMLEGIIAAGTTATLNAAGDIAFQLDDAGVIYSVTVDVPAALLDTGGTTPVSTADALSALNADPARIIALGNNPPSGTAFAADVRLSVLPMPGSLDGVVAAGSTAFVNGAGNIEFSLDTGAAIYQVTVPAGTTAYFFDAGATQFPDATATIALLNAMPSYDIGVTGNARPNGSAFLADIQLVITFTPDILDGAVATGSTAALDGAGNIVFDLDDGTSSYTVTANGSGILTFVDRDFASETLDAASAVARLNQSAEYVVSAAGSFTAVAGEFDASRTLTIIEPAVSQNGLVEPGALAVIDGSGDIRFQFRPARFFGRVYSVTVDVGPATLETQDAAGAITAVSAADAVAALNSGSAYQIILTSSVSPATDTYSVDNLMRIYLR